MLRQYRSLLPDILLCGLVLHYWWSTTLFNPIAFGFLTVIAIQLKRKNNKLGIAIGGLFLFVSLWMILACLSDLAKPPKNPGNILNFVFYGAIYCLALFASSVLMLVKYSFKKVET